MELKNSRLNTGVSPVIGVILMVVITVVLGAIVANYMLAFGESSDQQNPAASTSFDQVYDANGEVTDESHLASGATYDDSADTIDFDEGDGTVNTYSYDSSTGTYVEGDGSGDTAEGDGAFGSDTVDDFRVQTGEFTVEVQLTRAANIDFVEVGGAPNYVEFSSTDDTDSAGANTADTTMENVGDVITVENIGDGDRFNVVGSLQGNEQILNRYEVRQR